MVWTVFNAQLGVRLNFDIDVKILLNFHVDGTNVKTVSPVASLHTYYGVKRRNPIA